MTEPSTGERVREGWTRAIAALRELVPQRFRRDRPVVPVLRLTGVIGFSTPLRPGLSMGGIARALDRLFAVRNAAAVALIINSPGGSPAQSHLIFRRIRDLAQENSRKVIAFVEDAAASGGYMIACAADEIIADPNSIVGSIGVVGGSFGFDKLIAKIGIERRLYTSGEHKAMLDPFLPEDPADVERLKTFAAGNPRRFHRAGEIAARRQTQRSRGQLVLRRILDRTAGAGLRPGRCARRLALDAARAIRRQSVHAAHYGGTRAVRPAGRWHRRRRVHAAGSKPACWPCRRHDFGA